MKHLMRAISGRPTETQRTGLALLIGLSLFSNGYPSHVNYKCSRTYSTYEYDSIDAFFEGFYPKLCGLSSYYSQKSKTNISEYHYSVFDLLKGGKGLPYDDLKKLQEVIERYSMSYDDYPNIYQASPVLLQIISKSKDGEPSVKEYLKASSKKLTSDDLECINEFRQYALEVMIIYTLGSVFNSVQDSPAVRLSTLVDQLNNIYRTHLRLFIDKKLSLNKKISAEKSGVEDPSGENHSYSVGILLVEFLLSRGFISILKDINVSDTPPIVNKKKGKYYLNKSLFAVCNFDIDLLPVRYNLPMICKPMDWDVVDELKCEQRSPQTLSDLIGGYLTISAGSFYLYNRYNLITSRNLNNFNILLGKDYRIICDVMNKLQSEAFEINKDVLNFIKKNYNELVKDGLLMPKFLAKINISEAIILLRKTYLEDKIMVKDTKYQDILKEFLTRVQRSRYECFILDLASAYEGYEFYLPAFVDFRGRIYRAGVLHFHERDIARSLIVFAKSTIQRYDDGKKVEDVSNIIQSAAGFHYKKFDTYDDARKWYLEQKLDRKSDKSLIQFIVDASDPYQFLSKVLCLEKSTSISPLQIPITQDASASAYQIISYFLLDHNFAVNTNLIPKEDDKDENRKIQDVYIYILDHLKDHLKCILPSEEFDAIYKNLTRKLVKSLFMPLVYGKTAYSMSDDLLNVIGNNIYDRNDCMKLALKIERFFKEKYSQIINLMNLVRAVGWIASTKSRPVYYSTPVLTTIQDYKKWKAVNIWVYDRFNKKRRQVTLRVPTHVRDRKKTTASIFANFIHQKDANLAFYMIFNAIKHDIPIYTVHDNFITTAMKVPGSYIDIFVQGPGSLEYINSFILQNLMMGCHHHIYDSNIANEKFIEYFKYQPIPDSVFTDLLQDLPPHIKEALWRKKVLELSHYYKLYISAMCGCSELYDDSSIDKYGDYYKEELSKFKNSMLKWNECHNNYSLHL